MLCTAHSEVWYKSEIVAWKAYFLYVPLTSFILKKPPYRQDFGKLNLYGPYLVLILKTCLLEWPMHGFLKLLTDTGADLMLHEYNRNVLIRWLPFLPQMQDGWNARRWITVPCHQHSWTLTAPDETESKCKFRMDSGGCEFIHVCLLLLFLENKAFRNIFESRLKYCYWRYCSCHRHSSFSELEIILCYECSDVTCKRWKGLWLAKRKLQVTKRPANAQALL